MGTLQVYQLLAHGSWLAFMFAYGACVGSLINVLVYRMPRGMPVIMPTSRCPACETKLTWRENIPVLGWLILHGRCRFCKSRISPEYPLVEALVGLLFVAAFVLWYLVPQGGVWGNAVFLGVDWSLVRPEWAVRDAFDGFPRSSWPEFIILCVLLGCLTAMTIVDAKTFTIPLQLPWAATLVGVVVHTAHAMGVQYLGWARFQTSPASVWAIATPGGGDPGSIRGWWWIGASLGAFAGLGLSMLFLHFRLMRRSFADYQQWEDAERAKAGLPISGADTPPSPPVQHLVSPDQDPGWEARGLLYFTLIWAGLVLVLGGIGSRIGPQFGVPPWAGTAVGALGGPLIAAGVLRLRRKPGNDVPDQESESPPQMWIQYPHARREMVKEILFLTPAIALGWVAGSVVAGWYGGGGGGVPPLWLSVLCGTLMGYLIGGGIVWAVRIGGSLAFGKEAMGLGDVHLMAGVGACVGWIDAALAFPLAAVVGLYWLVVAKIGGGGEGRAMPFGPYLAGATVLVVFGKPLVELGLGLVLGVQPGEAPIRLP